MPSPTWGVAADRPSSSPVARGRRLSHNVELPYTLDKVVENVTLKRLLQIRMTYCYKDSTL